ncbi:hypothetical protein ABZ801_11705 [Actinomadura sp. NPDC047616]|uniref:hypothetical protein n=1 Tax=Actinomadura sp. NPDC047616 TaxID=3155914 RepID=UPI0033E14D0A
MTASTPPSIRPRELGIHPPPGTRLKVTETKAERGGLCTVKLTELEEQPLVT